MAYHSADQATLERQSKIDDGSAESSCNGPHRRIEAVLGGLGFHLSAGFELLELRVTFSCAAGSAAKTVLNKSLPV